MVPLGGTTRLLQNRTVPFLPQTIKEDLAARKSRRSVSSYISKNKGNWVNWAPNPDEGTVLTVGDERVALTEQRVTSFPFSNTSISIAILRKYLLLCLSSYKRACTMIPMLAGPDLGRANTLLRNTY